MQLLKKGSTGLVVGNARANICAISGAALNPKPLNP